MILLISFACSAQFGNTWRKPAAVTNEDTANVFNSDTNDTGSPTPPGPLEQLWEQLDPNHCNDQLLGPGATGYFIGYYELTESESWFGVEQQVLFGSNNQEVIDGYCKTTWSMSGIQGEPGECGACQFSIFVSALPDNAQSDCPDSLSPSNPEWEVTYDILVANGTSEFYFNNSGGFIASGSGNSEFLSFVSSPVCYNF